MSLFYCLNSLCRVTQFKKGNSKIIETTIAFSDTQFTHKYIRYESHLYIKSMNTKFDINC